MSSTIALTRSQMRAQLTPVVAAQRQRRRVHGGHRRAEHELRAAPLDVRQDARGGDRQQRDGDPDERDERADRRAPAGGDEREEDDADREPDQQVERVEREPPRPAAPAALLAMRRR